MSTKAGREAFEVIRFFGPAESAFSIGYKVTPNGASHRGGIRYITDLDLYEIPAVLHGANRYATLLSVKGAAPVLETKSTTGVVAPQRRAGMPIASPCSMCGRPAAAARRARLRPGETLICGRCVEVAGEHTDDTTTEISAEDLAEVDRITSEEAYAHALGAEQMWELELDGTLIEATDDDPSRGRAWAGRNPGATWGRP